MLGARTSGYKVLVFGIRIITRCVLIFFYSVVTGENKNAAGMTLRGLACVRSLQPSSVIVRCVCVRTSSF